MKVHLYHFLKYCTTLLVLLFLVTNCEQEHEVETLAQNNSDFEIRKIDYDEILKIENLKEPFEKIKESLVVEKDIFNRTYYQENDSDKIQIAIDKAIEIKTDGYESYSFKVINPNLEKSSLENLIIERYDDSDFKYFIYTYHTKDNGENSREIVDVKLKEVTVDQINLSDFSNLFSYGTAGESCIVDVYVDFDCGCIYIKVISCDNDGGGGSGEGDSDNNDNDNDGSDNDNGNNNNTGDSGNNTGGSGGGSGGSGEGGGKNHPIIGVIDENEDDCNTFEERMEDLFDTEGGFVNDPADPGGATNKGISWPVWKESATSILGLEPTLENLQNLTSEQAKLIYKSKYWNPIMADDILDGDLRWLLFDFYVNAGGNAIKILQNTLNQLGENISSDGVMGNQTLTAINDFDDQIILYNLFKTNRQKYYEDITQSSINKYLTKNPNATEFELKKWTLKRFINGWTNRVNEFIDKTYENYLNVNC